MISLETSPQTTQSIPPQELQAKPMLLWSRDDTLKYAEYIKEKMSTWAACTHTAPNGLKVVTTPNPNATIKIYDVATNTLLYPST